MRRRRSTQQAVDIVKTTLKPYGLDTLVGKPALSDEVQKSLDAAIAKADNVALISAIFNSIAKLGPLLGMNRAPKSLIDLGEVTDYRLNGETATAQNRAETLRFVRVNGRWFIEPPGKGPGADAPPPGAAQQPAPRATATGKEPEIVAGGVQIARVVVADNEFSAKPFNSDNGTKIVLWVKMPAGQGLIEIDEDESLLQSFGDDKGTNMGGKFGSFPREFTDGAGGTIEIASTGFAAAGATALVAEGSVAMTVASGTRKIRAAKVLLQNNAKFTFEKTPIVVDQVEAETDSMKFTLNLPRRVMESIKGVAFFDAKGQPIEGSRTGSGYMNDAAEMGFTREDGREDPDARVRSVAGAPDDQGAVQGPRRTRAQLRRRRSAGEQEPLHHTGRPPHPESLAAGRGHSAQSTPLTIESARTGRMWNGRAHASLADSGGDSDGSGTRGCTAATDV